MEERSSWSRQKDEAILEETGRRRWFGGWRLKEISWSWRVGGARSFLSGDGVLEGKEDSHNTTTANKEKMNGLEDESCENEKKKKELWKSP